MDNDYKELYKPYRDEINILFYGKEYDKCLNKCKELLQMLSEKGTDEYHSWAVNYMLSLIYNRKNDITKALRYAKEAEKYLGSQAETTQHQHYWMMARYYEYFIDGSKIAKTIALRYYFKCRDFYARIQDELNLAKILHNIAMIQKNESLMEEVVELYEKLNNQGLMDKQNIEKSIYNLCCIYIEVDSYSYLKVQSLLHKLSNESYINDINDKLFNQSFGIV